MIKTRYQIWLIVITFVMALTALMNYLIPSSSPDIVYDVKSAGVPNGSTLILYVFKSPLNITPEGNLVKMSGPFGLFKSEFELCNPECKMTVYPGRNFPNITVEKTSSGIRVSWTSIWLRPRK